MTWELESTGFSHLVIDELKTCFAHEHAKYDKSPYQGKHVRASLRRCFR